MAAITWTDVTNHAPELSTVTAGAQTDVLAYVNAALSVSLFGDETSPRLKLCRVLLAAHLATLEAQRNTSGPVTAAAAGGLSRSYGALASRSIAGTTGYGRAFLASLPPAAFGPQVL